MLSQQDRRRLQALEQQLRRDDADLVRCFTTWSISPRTRWPVRAAIGSVVLGTLGVLLSLLLLIPLLLVLTVPWVAAGWVWLIRLHALDTAIRDAGRLL
jgi:hypothetical protein